MQIYLPLAEMAVSAEVIILLGFAVGMVSGIFGVGGGFLATPFLIFMGIPPAIAVGTQASQLVAASTTGAISYWKKKAIDFKMAGILLIGGMVGTLMGVFIFRLLQYLGQIDMVIAILYVLFLCSVGGFMLYESSRLLIYSYLHNEIDMHKKQESSLQTRLKTLPYQIFFPKSQMTISAILPLAIGMIGGLMVSIMGIGAGFLLVPSMIYFLRMPPLLVPGTSLIQIIVTSSMACILHAMTNQSVDLILALILILGGVVGAQIGFRATKYISPVIGRVILGVLIMLVGLRMGAELLIPPVNLYEIAVQ